MACRDESGKPHHPEQRAVMVRITYEHMFEDELKHDLKPGQDRRLEQYQQDIGHSFDLVFGLKFET